MWRFIPSTDMGFALVCIIFAWLKFCVHRLLSFV